ARSIGQGAVSGSLRNKPTASPVGIFCWRLTRGLLPSLERTRPMTTLILGSSGQLGTAFRRLLPDAVAATRQHPALTEPETLRALNQLVKPDVVLNCAAYNAVDQAERDVAGAFAVNAFALRELASACRDAGAVLVHFSTNYVFGQENARRTPYRESDAAGP